MEVHLRFVRRGVCFIQLLDETDCPDLLIRVKLFMRVRSASSWGVELQQAPAVDAFLADPFIDIPKDVLAAVGAGQNCLYAGGDAMFFQERRRLCRGDGIPHGAQGIGLPGRSVHGHLTFGYALGEAQGHFVIDPEAGGADADAVLPQKPCRVFDHFHIAQIREDFSPGEVHPDIPQLCGFGNLVNHLQLLVKGKLLTACALFCLGPHAADGAVPRTPQGHVVYDG